MCPSLGMYSFTITKENIMTTDAIAIEGECGPASVSAGPLWGGWFGTIDVAAADALALVRRLAASQCSGTCPAETKCKYKEAKSSIDDSEERKDANGNVIAYRVKASSSGSCTCQ